MSNRDISSSCGGPARQAGGSVRLGKLGLKKFPAKVSAADQTSRFRSRMRQLSTAQRSRLQNAVAVLGNGLDWPAAAKKDLEALGSHYSGDSRVSVALSSIVSSYTAFLKDESNLPSLMDAINHAPPELAQLIPNPKRVEEQKQELSDKLQQTRMLLQ